MGVVVRVWGGCTSVGVVVRVWGGCTSVGWLYECGGGCTSVGWLYECGVVVRVWGGCKSVGWLYECGVVVRVCGRAGALHFSPLATHDHLEGVGGGMLTALTSSLLVRLMSKMSC